jgi:hypothetical protein
LEVRFAIANRDTQVLFGLLTELSAYAACAETLPGDETPILATGLRVGIAQLKRRSTRSDRCRGRGFLPVPPSRCRLESAGARMDGIRAQARKLGGSLNALLRAPAPVPTSR